MRIYRLEIAILMIIAIIFTYAAGVSIKQDQISNGILRLHVLANSDTKHDQEVKLIVRDAVLEFCKPLLENAENRTEVESIIKDNMQQIANIAQKTLWDMGENRGVSVRLSKEYYPTRDYTSFSLPAGEYLGLRVIIGDGEGKNWWCVVFPPLCNEVATDDDTKTKDLPKKYTIKFKTAEVVGKVRNIISDII